MAGAIWMVVEDLFFRARIEETARRVGVKVEAVNPGQLAATLLARVGTSEGSGGQEMKSGDIRAIILDLNGRSPSAVELLRAIKKDPATRGLPVVGFVSHVQSDLVAAARNAGCDTVLARSAFTTELPQLLPRLACR